MELFVFQYLNSKEKNVREGFENEKISWSSLILAVWSLLVGIWAIGDSWHCNSLARTHIILKFVYSIFALMFANIYLFLRLFRVLKCFTVAH